MSPLVSIVIPTFNQAKYLPACFTHCLFQSYGNLELIVVDGGSTDFTKRYLSRLIYDISSTCMYPVNTMSSPNEIIREKISVYPKNRRIKICSFSSDIGATRSYNEGFKLATGKYVTYIPGDDLPHPHMIETLVGELENGKADFAYSDMNLINDDHQIIRQMRLPDYDFKHCLADWFHIGVSKLYRSRLHETIGLMDEAYQSANDYDHYLRFAIAGATFVHVPRILYSIRYHGPQRQIGQHTPKRYQNLLDESCKCALRARQWLNDKIS